MSAFFCLYGMFALLLPILLNARYDAYVTSDGTSNPSCTQSAPCGLFQIVIQNIESGNIPNDDLYIHINGTNSFIFMPQCKVLLSGKITFIFDPDTITTANDWYGEMCPIDICNGAYASCTYNLLTVGQDSNVAFYDLVWDNDLPLLKSAERSSFYCERCLIQNLRAIFGLTHATFLFANEATFKDSTFRNVASSPVFELFPLSFDFFNPQTDSLLTFIGCTMLNISSNVFIDISASTGTCLQ